MRVRPLPASSRDSPLHGFCAVVLESMAPPFLLSGKMTPSEEQIPFIALTAHVMEDEVRQFLHHGFAGFVPKPIERNELQREIERVVCRPAR